MLSTAEAISLLSGGMSLAGHFGDGVVRDADVAPGLRSAVVRDDAKDEQAWVEYVENVMRKRGGDWKELHAACKAL